MKDSYNYSGFSNTFLMAGRKKKSTRKNPVIVDRDDKAGLENDPARFYPPFLMQPQAIKAEFKK
jgi:hypothetical protein